MKKILTSIILILVSISITSRIFPNTVTVQAGGMTFTPSVVDVNVGDTVKWVWLNGIHTTTSVTEPSGALTWTSPLDSTHTSFIYVVTNAGQYNYHCNFHYIFGMTGVINSTPIAIKPVSNIVPDKFKLYQNYPNPFNPSTNIKFDIAKNSVVKLIVYDMNGKEVETLVKGELQPGTYSIDWNASKFSSGVYFYKMEMPGFTETKKLMILK